MIKDEDYWDLPEDPERAFLALEKEFREELAKELSFSDLENRPDSPHLSYMSKVEGAAEALNIKELSDWEIPGDEEAALEMYKMYIQEVAKFRTIAKIRFSRRRMEFSVRLDEATREKLRHHLKKLLEVAQKLEVIELKRNAIIAKIAALSVEIENPRTRYEHYTDLAISIASTTGEAANKLEPLRKLLDTIAQLFGAAKEDEADNHRLSAPERPKLIEDDSQSSNTEGDKPPL